MYSIRMRAAQGGPHESGGTHISGAERLVTKEDLTTVATVLIERALQHSKGNPDFINIQIDEIPHDRIKKAPLLQIESSTLSNLSESHQVAMELLQHAHISSKAIQAAFHRLKQNPPTCSGAWLIHSETGEIHDHTIRVSRMDTAHEEELLATLDHHGCPSTHTREAILLASKVLSCPHILGELCWSDDPDYTTGYVAYGSTYHRLSPMKELGSSIGGRAFFFTHEDHLEEIKDYLSSTPVLIEKRKLSCSIVTNRHCNS